MLIKIIIDRLEGEKAVLKTEQGETIVWPRHSLPEGAGEGTAFYFKILPDREKEKESRETAREILNEILNNN